MRGRFESPQHNSRPLNPRPTAGDALNLFARPATHSASAAGQPISKECRVPRPVDWIQPSSTGGAPSVGVSQRSYVSWKAAI